MGVIPAIIGGVASIAGGAIAGGAAGHAADVQAAAANRAADVQLGIYNQTRNDLNPFVRAGTGGLNYLSSLVPGGLKLSNPTGSGAPGGSPATSPGDPSNPKTIQINTGMGITEVPNPNYDPTKPDPNAPFQLDPAGPANPFLTGLQDLLPGGGDPSLKGALSLLPGGDSPLQTALNGYIPGSGAPTNAITRSLQNFIPGASDTPDASLSSLRSFVPGGGTENPLLQKLNALLGIGGDADTIQSALEATPGYKFTRDQGLKATQNSFAARGLGNSGAALRGAADYTTGLAGNTYEQRLSDYLNSYNSQFTNTYNAYNSQFSNNLNAYNTGFTNTYNTVGQGVNNSLNAYNSKFTNALNAYNGQVNLAENIVSGGQNAAAQTGDIGQHTSAVVGNTLTSGAAAQAAGIVGGANALTNSLGNIAGIAGLYYGNNNNGQAAVTKANPNANAITSGMYGVG